MKINRKFFKIRLHHLYLYCCRIVGVSKMIEYFPKTHIEFENLVLGQSY